MFGLTIEKLFVVAIIAGVLIGPRRLPEHAQRLAQTIRAVKRYVDTARSAIESDTGISLQRADWQSWDPTQYDPRKIVREAMNEPVPAAHVEAIQDAARSVRPGQKYLVTGSSSRPQRLLIASLPADDPRRIAAERQPDPSEPADAATSM